MRDQIMEKLKEKGTDMPRDKRELPDTTDVEVSLPSAVEKRLKRGDTLRFYSRHTGAVFGNGDVVPYATFYAMKESQQIREQGSHYVLTSPKKEAARAAAAERERKTRKRDRLDRWSQLVHAAKTQEDLDKVLEAVAREAMPLGSLED